MLVNFRQDLKVCRNGTMKWNAVLRHSSITLYLVIISLFKQFATTWSEVTFCIDMKGFFLTENTLVPFVNTQKFCGFD